VWLGFSLIKKAGIMEEPFLRSRFLDFISTMGFSIVSLRFQTSLNSQL
jgi:hypothetical protein